MQNKLFGIISLSRKAGKLIYGFDAVKDAARRGEATLVLYSSDVSERTERTMERAIAECEPPPPTRKTKLPMFEYGRICGKAAGVLALTDSGFADAAIKLIAADEEE